MKNLKLLALLLLLGAVGADLCAMECSEKMLPGGEAAGLEVDSEDEEMAEESEAGVDEFIVSDEWIRRFIAAQLSSAPVPQPASTSQSNAVDERVRALLATYWEPSFIFYGKPTLDFLVARICMACEDIELLMQGLERVGTTLDHGKAAFIRNGRGPRRLAQPDCPCVVDCGAMSMFKQELCDMLKAMRAGEAGDHDYAKQIEVACDHLAAQVEAASTVWALAMATHELYVVKMFMGSLKIGWWIELGQAAFEEQRDFAALCARLRFSLGSDDPQLPARTDQVWAAAGQELVTRKIIMSAEKGSLFDLMSSHGELLKCIFYPGTVN